MRYRLPREIFDKQRRYVEYDVEQQKERKQQQCGGHFEKTDLAYSFALEYGEQRALKER